MDLYVLFLFTLTRHLSLLVLVLKIKTNFFSLAKEIASRGSLKVWYIVFICK